MATDFPEREQHDPPDVASDGAPPSPNADAVPLLPPGDTPPIPGQLETAPDGSIRPASIADAAGSLDTPGLAGSWSAGSPSHEFSPPAPGLIDEAPQSASAADAQGAESAPPASAPAWAASAEIASASISGENDTERAAWPTVEPHGTAAAPETSTVEQLMANAPEATPAAAPQAPPTPVAAPPAPPTPAAAPPAPAAAPQAPAVPPLPAAEPPPVATSALPGVAANTPVEGMAESHQTIVRPPEENAGAKDMYDVPLGTLVYRSGLLSADQIESALAESERIGKRLGEVLIDSKMIDERDLGRLLAGQKGLPFLDLGQMEIKDGATELLPAASARIYCALPIAVEKGKPVVAVSDPTNGLVVEGVRRAMGGELSFAVATRSDLQAAIASHYGEDVQAIGAETIEAKAEPAPVPGTDLAAEMPQAPDDSALPVEPAPAPYTPAAEEATASMAAVDTDAPHPPPSIAEEHTPELPGVAAPEKTVRVMIRLTDGDKIDAGGFNSTDQAIERARALIDSIESNSSSEWPFLNGRFLRPETIVSIDLVDEQPTS